MFFNPRVKEKKEDFFNFEVLQDEFKKAIQDPMIPLIAIHGLRRTGKTSLIHVVLNSLKKKHVWIDAREIDSRQEFFAKIAQVTSKLRHFQIQKISVKGIEASLNLQKAGLDYLNKKKIILVIDEAQLLKKFKIDFILASVFDNYPRIKIILSGSETGMLMNFLGKNNSKAPLYGRAILELQSRRLHKEEAQQFLKLGGQKCKIMFHEREIMDAIAHLDGVIGWLTKYGWYRLRHSHKESLRMTVEEGKIIAKEEFLKFASRSEQRYIQILKLLEDGAQWKEIGQATSLSSKQLYSMLQRMIDSGFAEKNDKRYVIADPLLRAAFPS